MFCAVYCLDKPFSAALRSVTRDQHLAYLSQAGKIVKYAGALLSEDGTKAIGSLLILDMETVEAARDWAANDPYAKAGLFEVVDVHAWRLAFADGEKCGA